MACQAWLINTTSLTFKVLLSATQNRREIPFGKELTTRPEMEGKFPEKDFRKQRWFPLKDAVREAAQPGLRTLLFKLENAGI